MRLIADILADLSVPGIVETWPFRDVPGLYLVVDVPHEIADDL
ncbi:hypothetical protein [Corynebacterium sp.]|nr:hypothetical protein [Corynebacterium sp.]